MANPEMNFKVNLTVSPETADMAIKIINLYLKENPNFRPVMIEEVDNPANLPRKRVSFIAIEQVDPVIPEDPDAVRWETQYFDNKPFLFHCPKCGFIDSAKRETCGGCNSKMIVD